jgi:malate synthase
MTIQVLGQVPPQHQDIISPAALQFLAALQRAFNQRRKDLLSKRLQRQKRIEQGEIPDFLAETKWIREDPTWKVYMFN